VSPAACNNSFGSAGAPPWHRRRGSWSSARRSQSSALVRITTQGEYNRWTKSWGRRPRCVEGVEQKRAAIAAFASRERISSGVLRSGFHSFGGVARSKKSMTRTDATHTTPSSLPPHQPLSFIRFLCRIACRHLFTRRQLFNSTQQTP
jgi:hypothetical protein